MLRIANDELPPWLQPKIGASDVVQETLVEALRCFGQFNGQSPGELQGWLRTILLRQLAQATQHYAAVHKRQVQREVPADRRGRGTGWTRNVHLASYQPLSTRDVGPP